MAKSISARTLGRDIKAQLPESFRARIFNAKYLKPNEANYIVDGLGYNDIIQ